MNVDPAPPAPALDPAPFAPFTPFTPFTPFALFALAPFDSIAPYRSAFTVILSCLSPGPAQTNMTL